MKLCTPTDCTQPFTVFGSKGETLHLPAPFLSKFKYDTQCKVPVSGNVMTNKKRCGVMKGCMWVRQSSVSGCHSQVPQNAHYLYRMRTHAHTRTRTHTLDALCSPLYHKPAQKHRISVYFAFLSTPMDPKGTARCHKNRTNGGLMQW